jgi:hypothetical protein
MKKLLVAALMVVLASPAFAAIQNVKVSGDITSTFVDRNTFDLGLTNGTEANVTDGVDGSFGASAYEPVGLKKQNVFITQTRIRVDADLSDNVSTTVGLINERAWNAENTPGYGTSTPGATNSSLNDTNVQLYLASVTLRELLYSPLTVTVGRQVFSYGNGLVMGDGGVNNLGTGNLQYIAQDLTMRTAYDGVKAILDYKPLTIDMFYFKNGQTLLMGNPNSGQTSSDVYGFNANYQLSDPMNTVVEAYMFSRINGNAVGGASYSDKGDTLYVPGLRASTNPIKGLNVQGELAWQLGNHPVVNFNGVSNVNQAEKRQAMAAQLLASYALPVLEKYKPTVNASYTYVSGDKNGNLNYSSDAVKSAKVYTAWDPFNETQGGGTIYNTMFSLSNMHILALGASVNPLEDVTAAFTWSDLWAAVPYTNASNGNGSFANALFLLQPDSGTAGFIPATKHNATNLGNEYDVNFTYNYTEDVTFGVSLGWFVPGDVFTSANNNTASQAIADVAVKF